MDKTRIRILVVEDDTTDAQLLAESLGDHGRDAVDVEAVPTLQAASQAIGRTPPDVVLLDLTLPDSKGLESLHRLRNKHPDLPLVVLTGLEDELLGLEALRKGAQDYLVKGHADGRTILRAVRYAIERKQLQAEVIRAREIEAADKARNEFLAHFSHELRTPLNSVFGFTNILLKNRDRKLGEQDLDYLRRILDNGKYLLSILNNLLDLSRLQAGKIELEILPVDLKEIVQETVAQCEGSALGRPLELRLEMPARMEAIETDPVRLKQILMNLVSNAIKFTERGSVTVRCHVDPASHRPVRIDVVDTGIGIPADRQGAIFDAFRQADRSTTRRFGGSGLGLHISRYLAGMLGYRLELSSEVGAGSTFRLHLA